MGLRPAPEHQPSGEPFLQLLPTSHRRLAADYVIWADRLDEEIEGLFAAINQRRPAGEAPLSWQAQLWRFGRAFRACHAVCSLSCP